jgi:glutamate-ammonia-ligase adenylyltransferase
MDRERPSRSVWDLKLAPGGFVDIEFIVQALQLTHAARAPSVLSPNTGEALERLVAAGAIASEAGARLAAAWRLWSALQQSLRICVDGEFRLDAAPAPLLARLATLAGTSAANLESHLRAVQDAVRADFVQIVAAPSDGNPASPRS